MGEGINSNKPKTELLRLLMHNGSVAPLAELFDLQLLRLLLLVHRRRVVAPLAGPIRPDQKSTRGDTSHTSCPTASSRAVRGLPTVLGLPPTTPRRTPFLPS